VLDAGSRRDLEAANREWDLRIEDNNKK